MRPVPSGRVHSRVLIGLAVAAALWLLAWTVLPLFVEPEVPGDNLEQLNWALHPAWGYAKHPPFPTWILWIFEQLFPVGVPLTYALGGLATTCMLWLSWLLARATLREVPAWLAPVMVALINYYTVRMHYYNHNTVLMVAYAVALYCVWRAVSEPKWRWWLALGAAWGLGMLSKYQMAVPIACNLLFLWSVRSSGGLRLRQGTALACLTAGATMLPHLLWLIGNHFPTFGYASTVLSANLGLGARVHEIANFVLHQLGRAIPLLLLLLVLQSRLRRSAAPQDDVGRSSVTPDLARTFWTIHAWGPFALMVALCALSGIDLENHWGFASLWTLPMWILTTARGRRWAALPARFILTTAAILQCLQLIVYVTQIGDIHH